MLNLDFNIPVYESVKSDSDGYSVIGTIGNTTHLIATFTREENALIRGTAEAKLVNVDSEPVWDTVRVVVPLIIWGHSFGSPFKKYRCRAKG
ncbi:MAG: hypothetical protein DRQ98_13120 [Gammaproteobacteria bacterium]|nr:MAG: hypothetical protein DRQ98_13120 [Gammaproteobacteria bacterium]